MKLIICLRTEDLSIIWINQVYKEKSSTMVIKYLFPFIDIMAQGPQISVLVADKIMNKKTSRGV